MDNLYIVIPAYNEEKNIEHVVNSWYPMLNIAGDESRMVISDFGSTDSTNYILRQLKEKLPKLEIISTTKKEHGPKVISLYNYAIQKNADYIFQTDSDNQTNPDEFYYFWNNRDKYDAIIGNRTVRGDGIQRAFIEHVVCFILKIFFKVKIPDANAPFRLMRADLVKKYIDKIPLDFNIPNIILTTFFSYYSENIIFKEISFQNRKAGNSSINIVKIIKIGIKAIVDFVKFRKNM